MEGEEEEKPGWGKLPQRRPSQVPLSLRSVLCINARLHSTIRLQPYDSARRPSELGLGKWSGWGRKFGCPIRLNAPPRRGNRWAGALCYFSRPAPSLRYCASASTPPASAYKIASADRADCLEKSFPAFLFQHQLARGENRLLPPFRTGRFFRLYRCASCTRAKPFPVRRFRSRPSPIHFQASAPRGSSLGAISASSLTVPRPSPRCSAPQSRSPDAIL